VHVGECIAIVVRLGARAGFWRSSTGRVGAIRRGLWAYGGYTPLYRGHFDGARYASTSYRRHGPWSNPWFQQVVPSPGGGKAQ